MAVLARASLRCFQLSDSRLSSSLFCSFHVKNHAICIFYHNFCRGAKQSTVLGYSIQFKDVNRSAGEATRVNSEDETGRISTAHCSRVSCLSPPPHAMPLVVCNAICFAHCVDIYIDVMHIFIHV